MAIISKDDGGKRRILFVGPDKKRRTIRLGKVSQRAAEAVKFRIEQLLAAKLTGHAIETMRDGVSDTPEVVFELLAQQRQRLQKLRDTAGDCVLPTDL